MSRIENYVTAAIIGTVVVVGYLFITVAGDLLFTAAGAFIGIAVTRPGVFVAVVVAMLLFITFEGRVPRQPRKRKR